MKKIFILSIAALAALCACNEQRIVPAEAPAVVTGKQQIVFGLAGNDFLSMKSKAVTESTVATVEENGFKVAGVTSENTVLFNEVAKKVSDKEYYSTDTPYYYPTTGTTSFYAVYPNAEVIDVTEGVATVAYTSDGNKDFIVASATGVSASDESVALAFAHALSQVSFTAIGSDPNVTYKVESVTLTAPATGTYAYANNKWTDGTASSYTYVNEATEVSTSEATALGAAQTHLPTTLNVAVSWKCYSGGALVGEYTKDADFTPTMGKKCMVNLTLPNAAAKPITFTITVADWGEETRDITLE